MQIVAMAVPAQEGITRDNVSVRVDAVVYFRVVDPIKAVVNVQNYMFAVSQQAQTSLRSIIGQSEMDQLLAERDTVNRELRRIIDEPTEGPWGIRVERVEIKDVHAARGHEAVHVPAGRGRARAAGPDHHRRRRVPGVQAAGRGGQRDGPGPGRAAAAAAADRGRGRRGEEQHAGHAGPGRAAAVLRQDGARRRRAPEVGAPSASLDDSATRRWPRRRRRSRTPARRSGDRRRVRSRDARGSPRPGAGRAGDPAGPGGAVPPAPTPSAAGTANGPAPSPARARTQPDSWTIRPAAACAPAPGRRAAASRWRCTARAPP